MVVLSELSEGSSSSSSTHSHSSQTRGHSSSTHGHKYDVFLSFRGLDTRDSFTNHLYEALMHANITTFLDDEEVETGEDLKPELESAIKASWASIIILSKNYATSTWCLDELVLILEQRMKSNHIVIPVFYHVEPTHVRKQQSSFGDAMAKHKRMMEAETNASKRSQLAQKMDRWNKALIEVANLKGKDVNGRLETEFIEEIVKDIYRRLHIPLRSGRPQLIGMEFSIEFITSWLKDTSSHTADILTILGMGGIGKTSITKYVYELHCRDFHTCSYIEDISRRCDAKFNGLLDLQKQLYDDISKTSSFEFHDVSIYTSKIENALARKKVFLVLDDIDSLDQLDALLGSKGFHPGSKIIVTTKDAWLTESCALFKSNIIKPKHVEHMLRGLHENASLQLLCFHAFMHNHPKEGYEEVLDKLVKYCEGHPLALEVLGKSLHNQDIAYWEGCIEGLQKESGSHINNVLKMSFDSLPYKNDKELFKHIACFFVGIDRDVSETILKACDINTKSGITNLIDRFLLSIGGFNELKMHQLVQEMGRFEVRRESLEKPWKRSRLWCHKESFNVLKHKKGKGNILGLTLDMRMLEKEKMDVSFELKTSALSNMDSLMLLQLNFVHMNGSYDNFPEELRGLCMHGFPLKSIPSDLPMENLVAIDMSYSNIETFVICHSDPKRPDKRQKLDGACLRDKRLLGSLKILNLSFCKQLHSIGDFDQLPTLERLIVRNCTGLVEVCESIEQCVELVFIDLSYCNTLEKLPRNIGMLKKIKTLLLDGCNLGKSQIKNKDMNSSERHKANNIVINTGTSSPTFVGVIPRDLKLSLISSPSSLVNLSLIRNNLSTKSFPMDMSSLSMLKKLHIDENPIDSLPNCVRTLPKLEKLSMMNCTKLKSVEHPPRTLRELFIHSRKTLLEKVVFDPEMSPLEFMYSLIDSRPSSYEIEGMIKIQPIMDVEEKVLHSLGWINLDFLNDMHVGTNSWKSEIQMIYEFGIFSIMYEPKKMPNWFTHRSTGNSISFTIPSYPNKITGLNFCSIHILASPDERLPFPCDHFPLTPMITVNNITKNHMWIYERHKDRFSEGRECYTLLSHWMFGMNEMEGGDHVTITVTLPCNEIVKECGVRVVYDDGNMDEEEDALGYYKSWNHIIGGYLSPFQLTTGEYILHNWQFFWPDVKMYPYYRKFVTEGANYQARYQVQDNGWFRALSKRKPHIIGDTHEV
ncbi:hypothetical protein Lser_V15G02541 [Lactuca serriola]